MMDITALSDDQLLIEYRKAVEVHEADAINGHVFDRPSFTDLLALLTEAVGRDMDPGLLQRAEH